MGKKEKKKLQDGSPTLPLPHHPHTWLCNKSLWLVGKPQTQFLVFNQTKSLLCVLPAVAVLCWSEDHVPLIRRHWWPSLVLWCDHGVPSWPWWPSLVLWSHITADTVCDFPEQMVVTPTETISSGCKSSDSCFNCDNILRCRWWPTNGIYPSWQSIYLVFIFLGTGGILWKEHYPTGHSPLISIVSSK